MNVKTLNAAVIVLAAGWATAKAPVDYVNTKIGNISHMLVPTFPTTQRPNGLLRVTPPNESFTTEYIHGFCLSVPSHRQGQVFQMMPFSGEASALRPDGRSHYDHSIALPYRYSVFLDDVEVAVDLVPARRSALYTLTFENTQPRFVLLKPKQKGSLRIDGAALSGTDDFHGVTVYLYAEFDAQPARVGAFAGDHADFSSTETRDANKPLIVAFDPSVKTVRMRYGISYIGIDQAKRNLDEEIKDFDGDRLARDARDEWDRTLGRVDVEGGTENDKTVFYTALYRCYERMANISENGRYFSPWDGKVHTDGGIPFWTDDWTWDTYRAAHPLTTLLQPTAEGQKLVSYLRMGEQSGWVPTFPTVFGDAHCMNGKHCIALFLDAWRKGVRGFDLEQAYTCLKKTMLEESMVPWYRGPFTDLDRFYWEKGYFPALKPGEAETVKEVNRGERRQAVAVTLAAAYDAWCLGQIAKELGHQEDAALFLRHAHDYRNLWKKETGFFHPKDANGRWIEPLDYTYGGGQGARDYYDENNAWTYIWDVPHNVADLIALFSGRDPFNAKLDQLFAEGYGRPRWEFYNILPDSTGNVGMFVMGNEPSFHIPYLYDFSGEAWKTQKRVRMLMEAWFRNDLMGICGDEDGGGMSAFAVFSAMGFYPPTPGRPFYVFGSPIFRRVTLRLENGKRFRLVADRADHENKYIQSMKIDGQFWNKTWFSHDQLMNGGLVEIEMGDRPNKAWGQGLDALPPSEDPPTP